MEYGLSKKAYARHRKALGLPGGTPQAVRKALSTGRITLNEYGLIDPVMADRQWLANTSWCMQRYPWKKLG